MKRILIRTVKETGGKEWWVEPVLKFMFEELSKVDDYVEDHDDPRLGRALLAGGDNVERFIEDFRRTCLAAPAAAGA